MKTSVVIALGLVASAEGFAPARQERSNTQLQATLFDRIFGLDLFAPVQDQNDYGARTKKELKVGKISQGSSYVPNGMDAATYNKIRDRDLQKKKNNYEKNVKKAGVFEDYTEWYIKRGTDTNAAWKKDVNLGHRMTKTKYDWDGLGDKKLWVQTDAEKKIAASKNKKTTNPKSAFSFFGK